MSVAAHAHVTDRVKLGDDIWIGAHATIVDGVKVRSHVLFAARAWPRNWTLC